MTRTAPPLVADERATYPALLDYLRAMIELKVEGLSGWCRSGAHWAVSARRVLAHVIEETARHAGHLDAVRELLDRTTCDWAVSCESVR